MSDENNPELNQPQNVRPYWRPDVPIEDLPGGLRLAVETIIGPAYQELVMGAEGTMEQLTGLSAVYLTELEIIDQVELAETLLTASPEERHTKVTAYAKLSGAKLRTLSFLQRLRDAREKVAPDGRSRKSGGNEPKS